MTDMPPPYPGINGYSGYNTSYANATAPPPPMGFSVPPESQNGKKNVVYCLRYTFNPDIIVKAI